MFARDENELHRLDDDFGLQPKVHDDLVEVLDPRAPVDPKHLNVPVTRMPPLKQNVNVNRDIRANGEDSRPSP